MNRVKVITPVLLLLSLTSCGTKNNAEASSENPAIFPPIMETAADPPTEPPDFDERQIAYSDKSELYMGMYTVTDYLENGAACRESSYNSDGSLFSQTYYTQDGNGVTGAYTFLADGTLLSYSLFFYDVEGAARREFLYGADSSRLPQSVTDTDTAGRIIHQWQDGSYGERTEWKCDYTPDSPKVSCTFSIDVDQDRVSQDRPGMYIQVEEFTDSETVSYEMQSPDHQVIYGGHSSGGYAPTGISLIECTSDGSYLLQNSFNRDGCLYFSYDCVSQQVLFEDKTLSPEKS